MVQDGEESWVLKKTDLSQVSRIDPLIFTSLPTILKVVGNTTRLMNPTSGGRSSEREVLETYLGMLDCDTVKRLFDRWIWFAHAHFLIVFFAATQVLCRLFALQLFPGGGVESGKQRSMHRSGKMMQPF